MPVMTFAFLLLFLWVSPQFRLTVTRLLHVGLKKRREPLPRGPDEERRIHFQSLDIIWHSKKQRHILPVI